MMRAPSCLLFRPFGLMMLWCCRKQDERLWYFNETYALSQNHVFGGGVNMFPSFAIAAGRHHLGSRTGQMALRRAPPLVPCLPICQSITLIKHHRVVHLNFSSHKAPLTLQVDVTSRPSCLQIRRESRAEVKGTIVEEETLHASVLSSISNTASSSILM